MWLIFNCFSDFFSVLWIQVCLLEKCCVGCGMILYFEVMVKLLVLLCMNLLISVFERLVLQMIVVLRWVMLRFSVFFSVVKFFVLLVGLYMLLKFMQLRFSVLIFGLLLFSLCVIIVKIFCIFYVCILIGVGDVRCLFVFFGLCCVC